MKVRKHRNAIVLASSMLVVMLTLMVMSAGLTLSQMSLNLQGSSEDLEAAHEAAQAGLAYARTRLQEDPKWRGGTADQVMVDVPGRLWVREHRGNVLGLLTTPGGDVSRFRIRFNYQNGTPAADPDSLPDPATPVMNFDLPYVSENNLDVATLRPVYRAVPSGGTYKVLSSSPTPFDVGRYSAVILVEGSSGDALRGVSSSNPIPPTGNRRLARKVVEAVFTRNMSKIGDAAVNGALNLDFTLNSSGSPTREMIVASNDQGVPPRARSMGNVTVTASGTTPVDFGSNGEVYVKPLDGTGPAGEFRVNTLPSAAATVKQEDSRNNIPSVTWAEIPKADSSDAKLAAGTYVWREKPRRLEYYAQEFTPGAIPATVALGGPAPDAVHYDGSTLDGGTGAVTMNKAEMGLEISRDLYVNPVSGAAGPVKGLAVVAESSLIAALENRPDIHLKPPSAGAPNPVVTSMGAVHLTGELSGKGSVTAEGDITFQGSSVLEADANGKVAVYSKENISLERIPPAVGSSGVSVVSGSGAGSGGSSVPISSFLGGPSPFGTAPSSQDIGFAGLFYAMGNVTAKLGATTAADPGGAAPAADLYFRGVVVAYGGNPDLNQLPGAAPGKGAINLQGGKVHMVYDSSYIVNAINFLTPAKLDLKSYQAY